MVKMLYTQNIFLDGGRIADVHGGSDQLPMTENG